MDTEQFSLCWNNFHNNLSSGFQDLLKDEDLVDVTLAAEGRYVKAHKTVLSVCSPYFKDLFRVNPCKHPIVILHDINYNALNALLTFMYQGEVSVSQEEIPMFMRVAEILKVKGLTDNAGLSSTKDTSSANGLVKSEHSMNPDSPLLKRNRPMKKLIKPIQHLKPLEFPSSNMSSMGSMNSSPPDSPLPPSNSPPPSMPPMKQQRLEDMGPSHYMEPTITPKQEPIDHIDDEYREPPTYEEKVNTASSMLDNSMGESSDMGYGMSKVPVNDVSIPGTLQCILGKRGLPRLIVDGYTFFKKSTYKNKCFWYCKTNRSYKCPAVCWTVNGRIVKWPEAHTHGIVPEVITPGEDTVVPIEMLRQVLIDAAR